MNLKYLGIILKSKINKVIQKRYVYVPSDVKEIELSNYGDLFLTEYVNTVYINVNKTIGFDKEVLSLVIKRLLNQGKTVYINEEIKMFTYDDYVDFLKISSNFFINERYIEKTNSLASNQILTMTIHDYVQMMKKLLYFTAKVEATVSDDLQKIILTILQITQYIEYGEVASNKESCVSKCLEHKKGVCIDISVTMYKCMELMGIECEVIKGIGGNDSKVNNALMYDHAWNQIKYNGNWYNMDITWFETSGVTAFLLASDKDFYIDTIHQTMFKVHKCDSSIPQVTVFEYIDKLKKIPNFFDEFDKKLKY